MLDKITEFNILSWKLDEDYAAQVRSQIENGDEELAEQVLQTLQEISEECGVPLELEEEDVLSKKLFEALKFQDSLGKKSKSRPKVWVDTGDVWRTK